MVVLGLGSNVGERQDFLRAAIDKLSGLLTGMTLSRVLESAALVIENPPPGAERAFLNMAVCGETTLAPKALLVQVKRIEQELGRVYRCKWGPREIDIDILAMDGVVFAEEGLVVPHPELLNRDFALIPLNDVAPFWFYPGEGEFKGRMPGEIIIAKGYAFGNGLRETGITL